MAAQERFRAATSGLAARLRRALSRLAALASARTASSIAATTSAPAFRPRTLRLGVGTRFSATTVEAAFLLGLPRLPGDSLFAGDDSPFAAEVFPFFEGEALDDSCSADSPFLFFPLAASGFSFFSFSSSANSGVASQAFTLISYSFLASATFASNAALSSVEAARQSSPSLEAIVFVDTSCPASFTSPSARVRCSLSMEKRKYAEGGFFGILSANLAFNVPTGSACSEYTFSAAA
mmetsp:Transcript_67428/g.146922  ORF Transcript_67428/g.146922 Transcript_67428/m.146922 type:complete len:236 (+) Transcript_67428:178-885(+)